MSGGNTVVTFGHSRLDFERRLDCIDRAGEFHQDTVAHYLDDAAAITSEAWVDDLGAAFLQLRKRSGLVMAMRRL
jgi:hypothetical protein